MFRVNGSPCSSWQLLWNSCDRAFNRIQKDVYTISRLHRTAADRMRKHRHRLDAWFAKCHRPSGWRCVVHFLPQHCGCSRGGPTTKPQRNCLDRIDAIVSACIHLYHLLYPFVFQDFSFQSLIFFWEPGQVSTCGSSFDTWLHILGPGVEFSCDNCGDCGLQAQGTINVKPGECYQILIDGFAEGDYKLSLNCADLNAESFKIGCGSTAAGSTVGLANFLGLTSGKARYIFCPNQTVSAKISTCGSNFDTRLQVQGAGVDVDCDDCGDCGLQVETTLTFVQNECYEIFIDGFADGDYVLSINCTDVSTNTITVECGSAVTGTTFRLPSLRGANVGVQPHSFCPNQTVSAHISTCGSFFDTWLYVEGPSINFSCAECGNCPRTPSTQAEATLNLTAGGCYEIFVGGKGSEGQYALSISCNESVGANIICPVSVLRAELLEELPALPLTVWGSIAEMQSSLQDGLVSGQVIVPRWFLTAERSESELLTLLNSSIKNHGIHLVIHLRLDLLRNLTGWSLDATKCSLTSPVQLAGGGFAKGPKNLEVETQESGSRCAIRSLLPATVDGLYGTYAAVAWTSPYGKGRITYFGADYFALNQGFKKLLQSSIRQNCDPITSITNTATTTTTTTVVLVECGSIVNGSIVPGMTLKAQSARHTFCTPGQGGSNGSLWQVLFSTCGSSFDTALSVLGSTAEDFKACADCGSCGISAELKFFPEAGTCYDVAVYGSRIDLGNYTLWVSCCDPSLCNGRGNVIHQAWGPPSDADLCRCQCLSPWSGPTCDECDRKTLTARINGTCQKCFEERNEPFSVLALSDLSFTWPINFLQPECNSSIELGYTERFAELQRIKFGKDQNGSELELSFGSCSEGRVISRDAGILITANGNPLGQVVCAPKLTCDFDSADSATENNSSNLFVVHFLPTFLQSEAIFALSFIDLLITAFNTSNRTFVLHGNQNSFIGYLNNSNVTAEVQFFFNLHLSEPSFSCTIDLPDVDPATELVVLVGSLCGNLDRLQDLLLPVLQPGRQIVNVALRRVRFDFLSLLEVTNFIPDAVQPTCGFLNSWLWFRQNQCVQEAFTFAPLETLAFERSVLEFPRLCNITACCIGEQCSEFLTGGFVAGCYLPLLEQGTYNVSVIFKDGGRTFAATQLTVLGPRNAGRYRAVRLEASPNLLYGVFRNWTREVRKYSFATIQNPECCELVAIAYDLTVMGKLDTTICGRSFNLPLPQIDNENPFPQPVRFMAVRCFPEQASQAVVDESSCDIPDVASITGQVSEEMGGTWNLRRRIDEYVEAAKAMAPRLQLFGSLSLSFKHHWLGQGFPGVPVPPEITSMQKYLNPDLHHVWWTNIVCTFFDYISSHLSYTQRRSIMFLQIACVMFANGFCATGGCRKWHTIKDIIKKVGTLYRPRSFAYCWPSKSASRWKRMQPGQLKPHVWD